MLGAQPKSANNGSQQRLLRVGFGEMNRPVVPNKPPMSGINELCRRNTTYKITIVQLQRMIKVLMAIKPIDRHIVSTLVAFCEIILYVWPLRE
jgi:hypothetical protein